MPRLPLIHRALFKSKSAASPPKGKVNKRIFELGGGYNHDRAVQTPASHKQVSARAGKSPTRQLRVANSVHAQS
jgi:hypothetical protein